MEQNHSTNWGWMLYTDFFLGALGGSLLILGSLTTLFYSAGYVSVAYFLAPVIAMGLGSSLLVLDLGNPFRAWRVITNPKSFLTIGASLMTISMGLSVLLASFYIPILPWSHLTGLRKALALLAILTGFGVAFYPGLLLGGMVSRPFWRGPLLAPLFLLSGLSTGIAAFCLLDRIWPSGGEYVFCSLTNLNVLFLVGQIIGWATYVYIKHSLASPKEADALTDVFSGGRRIILWGGFMGLGLFVPAAFYIYAGPKLTFVAHLLVLIGAYVMRGFVVTADQRVPLEFSR